MSTIVVDVEAGAFESAQSRVEVRNASGKLPGTFLPQPAEFREYEPGEIPVLSPEERREVEGQIRRGEVYTTEQVLAHLRSLESA